MHILVSKKEIFFLSFEILLSNSCVSLCARLISALVFSLCINIDAIILALSEDKGPTSVQALQCLMRSQVPKAHTVTEVAPQP